MQRDCKRVMGFGWNISGLVEMPLGFGLGPPEEMGVRQLVGLSEPIQKVASHSLPRYFSTLLWL